MKSVYYTEGPESITAGVAGRFEIGIPKELTNEVANLLLAKPIFQEYIAEKDIETTETATKKHKKGE